MRPIDADLLKEALDADSLKEAFLKHHVNACWLGRVFTIINEAPTIDYAPVVRGEWVYQGNQNFPYCSECMMPQDMPTNFCPSCGAKMKALDDD